MRNKATGLKNAIQKRIDGIETFAVKSDLAPLADAAKEGLANLLIATALELEVWEADKTPASNDQFAKKLAEREHKLRDLAQRPLMQPLTSNGGPITHLRDRRHPECEFVFPLSI